MEERIGGMDFPEALLKEKWFFEELLLNQQDHAHMYGIGSLRSHLVDNMAKFMVRQCRGEDYAFEGIAQRVFKLVAAEEEWITKNWGWTPDEELYYDRERQTEVISSSVSGILNGGEHSLGKHSLGEHVRLELRLDERGRLAAAAKKPARGGRLRVQRDGRKAPLVPGESATEPEPEPEGLPPQQLDPGPPSQPGPASGIPEGAEAPDTEPGNFRSAQGRQSLSDVSTEKTLSAPEFDASIKVSIWPPPDRQQPVAILTRKLVDRVKRAATENKYRRFPTLIGDLEEACELIANLCQQSVDQLLKAEMYRAAELEARGASAETSQAGVRYAMQKKLVDVAELITTLRNYQSLPFELLEHVLLEHGISRELQYTTMQVYAADVVRDSTTCSEGMPARNTTVQTGLHRSDRCTDSCYLTPVAALINFGRSQELS